LDDSQFKIKKNSTYNLLGSLLPMIIGILVIPYLDKNLGIERIGLLTIFWSLIGYFSVFDFGLGRAITQKISSINNDLSDLKKKSTIGLFLTLILGFLGTLISVLLLQLFPLSNFKISQDLINEVTISTYLVCFSIPLTTFSSGARGILEGVLMFKEINILKFFLGLTNFIFPVISIILFGNNLIFIVALLLFSRLIYCILIYNLIKSYIISINIKESQSEVRSLFIFGGWMTISNIISPLMVIADRFVIGFVLGVSVVAYYTVPSEFLIKLLIIPAAITTSVFPVFSNLFFSNKKRLKKIYNKTIILIFSLMFVITALTFVFSEFGLEIWLGYDYKNNSSLIVKILLFGILFNSIAQVPYSLIQSSGDAKSTTIIHVTESIIYFPLLFLLINKFGIIGAALAWTTRACIDFILLKIVALKKITK